MNKEDVRIDIISKRPRGVRPATPTMGFVKVTHMESGISFTAGARNQIKARDEAMEYLEVLVEEWGLHG